VTPVGATFDLTPLDDIASTTMAANGALAAEFRFTSGNDVVNGMTATMSASDVLIDGSTTDSDVLNVTATGTTAITTVNIETVNVTATSGTVVFNAAAVTGVTSVTVTGAVAATVDNVAAAATITSVDYGRILTVDDTNYDGTTTDKNPDTLNLAVSGGTWGTTAATQTGFALISDNASTIETLNVTSSGSAANVYDLDASTNVSLSTVNFLGSADQTVRVDAGDVTGLTVVGGAATGSVALRIDTNGTSAAVNAANFSGIDNFIMADSTVGSDNASISSLYSGAKITLGDDFGGENSVFTVKGATYTAPAASLTVVLDNETASDAVDAQQIDVQNIAALNIVSSGYASESTSVFNLIDDLVGDAATITITGDTSLNLDANIDATQTATSTSARAVTVDASGMTGTAFLDFAAAANSKVSYTVTGTANDDTLVANASGASLIGAAGKDTLTGGDGDDTIDGGAGNDHIDVSYGEDTLTGGAGNDTYDAATSSVAAASDTQTLTVTFGSTGIAAADDTFVANINGEVITWLHDVSAATTVTLAADEAEAAIKASDGFLNGDFTVSQASGALTITFDADLGDVADITIWGLGDDVSTAAATELTGDATNGTLFTAATTQEGSLAQAVESTITDFASGDVLDIADMLSSAGAYHEGAASGAAAGDSIIVLTSASYATAALAQAAIDIATTGDDGLIVYLNSTTGTAEAFYDVDTDATGDGSSGTTVFTFESITTLTDLAAVMSADSFVI
jgi:hypothetical protein